MLRHQTCANFVQTLFLRGSRLSNIVLIKCRPYFCTVSSSSFKSLLLMIKVILCRHAWLFAFIAAVLRMRFEWPQTVNSHLPPLRGTSPNTSPLVFQKTFKPQTMVVAKQKKSSACCVFSCLDCLLLVPPASCTTLPHELIAMCLVFSSMGVPWIVHEHKCSSLHDPPPLLLYLSAAFLSVPEISPKHCFL